MWSICKLLILIFLVGFLVCYFVVEESFILKEAITLMFGILALIKWLEFPDSLTTTVENSKVLENSISNWVLLIPWGVLLSAISVTSLAFLWVVHSIWLMTLVPEILYIAYIHFQLRRYRRQTRAQQIEFCWSCLTPWMLASLRSQAQNVYFSKISPQQISFVRNPEIAFINQLIKTVSPEVLFPGRQDPVHLLDYIHNLFSTSRAQFYQVHYRGFSLHFGKLWVEKFEESWLRYVNSSAFTQHLDTYLFQEWVLKQQKLRV